MDGCPNNSDPSQKFNRIHQIREVMYKVHQSLYLSACSAALCDAQLASTSTLASSVPCLLVSMV